MKVTVTGSGPMGVSISIEAESEAEKYQIEGITKQLEEAKIEWGSWGDMHGRNGICIQSKPKNLVAL